MGAKWTKSQVQGTQAAELNPNLFGMEAPSRADKMRASRKLTNKFTAFVIEYLNNTGHFTVCRNNNLPSTRISRDKIWTTGKTETGQFVKVEIPVVHFKKHQITVSALDIIGFRIKDGKHVEIEVKYGKDKLDKDQKRHLANLQKAGCISFVAMDKPTLKQQIDKWIEEILPF